MNKVLITGGAGFIGTHLVNKLSKKGYDLSVIDLKERPLGFASSATYIHGDVRDKKLMNSCLKGVDICFHLAAVFGGPKFMNDNQARMLSENIDMLTSVFDAAANNSLKRIIFPSTSLVYNEELTIPVTEEDTEKYPPTKNTYGFAKLTGEYYCHAYWKDKKLPFTIVRLFNVYGPGDTHDHVIPVFIKKILQGQFPFEIMGDGQGTRVFTYVDDIIEALVKVFENDKTKNNIYNVSSEKEVTIISLAETIWKLCGRKEEFQVKYIPLPGATPQRRAVSAAKIKQALGWNDRTSLEEGLKKTIQWIKTLEK